MQISRTKMGIAVVIEDEKIIGAVTDGDIRRTMQRDQLFNKFTPLEEGSLKEKITNLLKSSGFVSDGLFIMDASKRSNHSNAYFTGFGKSKRIVLYDTLVKSLTEDELVAVLGHELGHFKLKHILKRLLFVIPLEFVLMFVLYKIAQFVQLYSGFGFSSITPENVGQTALQE